MRLALFGATGRAGGAILAQSRAAGHEIQALARSPGRLDQEDPRVGVTAGDVRDVAAADLPFPGDPRNLGRPVMRAMLRTWNRHLIADTYRMAEVLRASEQDWTLIRMPRLTAGPPGEGYRTGQLALGPWSRVTTGQVGHFTLACLATGGPVREAPMIADARPGGRNAAAGERSGLATAPAGPGEQGRS